MDCTTYALLPSAPTTVVVIYVAATCSYISEEIHVNLHATYSIGCVVVQHKSINQALTLWK